MYLLDALPTEAYDFINAVTLLLLLVRVVCVDIRLSRVERWLNKQDERDG